LAGSFSLKAAPPAFPGAVGFGSGATGARGGTVYHVTNLNDSGSGSFRTGVGTAGATVVFDVGGYVTLSSAVSVANNVTIAGQTAPGGGIGIQNDEVSFTSSTNVIVRGVRFRQGTNTDDTGESAVNLGDANTAILDHCSFEFGEWDSVDAVGAVNFTVSNCIIADPIGQQFGAHVETGPATFYNTVWVNAHNRQPLDKCNDQYINNVVYNYQAAYTVADTGGDFSHDILDNYFITGPSTTSPNDCFYQMDSNQSVYSTGNLLDSNDDGVLNGSSTTPGGVTVLTSPWSSTTPLIPTLSAAAAYASDILYSGALPHDQVDSLVISQVESLGTQGSILGSQDSDGLGNDGYGTIASGMPFEDTSGDGIADYWAQANGLSTTNAAVGQEEYGSTGYTNLEVYINSLILPVGWLGGDIGTPSIQGASSFNPFGGTWLIIGAGDGIWGTSDQFQFAAETYSGNGTILADVTTQTNTSASAKAGVMFRDSTAADGAYAYAVVTPGNGVYFQWRASDGASAQSSASVAGITAPVWLRVTRSGSSFSGYYSTNGTTWTQIGSTETITMPTAALDGLAVSSNNTGELSLGSFTSVTWPSGIANGTYRIVNLNSALSLDAVGQGVSPGTLIDQYTWNDGANQQWTLISLGSGEYNIVGVQSGLYVSSTSSTEGQQLALETGNGSSSQIWTISNASTTGYFTLKCAANSYLMDDYQNKNTPGTPVDQWPANGDANQEWFFTPQ
jgi:hypothetical protein